MRGILQVVLAAWCLVGAEPGKSVMDGFDWCNTLCLCRTGTQVEVQCFQWTQLYDQMVATETPAGEVEKDDEWLLEGQAYWCTDLCLCNTRNDSQLKCVQEKALIQLVTDNIDDWYLYDTEEEEEEEEPLEEERIMEERVLEQEEEEREEVKSRKRNEKRKNRKNRKLKKNIRAKEGTIIPVEEDVPLVTEPELEPTSEQVLTPGPTTPSLPPHVSAHQNETVSMEVTELLPSKQEAAASSSPLVTTTTTTTMQPPNSPQVLPTTVASALTTHEPVTTTAKVWPVREVPLERKTVASEVSQDLDELGNAILQIKSDVILNQRILLVTVAVAGIAMLGVLIMAVHGCSSRRQAAASSSLANNKKDLSMDDTHVTKINLEEAW